MIVHQKPWARQPQEPVTVAARYRQALLGIYTPKHLVLSVHNSGSIKSSRAGRVFSSNNSWSGFQVPLYESVAAKDRSTTIVLFVGTPNGDAAQGPPMYCERTEPIQIYKITELANGYVSFVFRNSASQLINNVFQAAVNPNKTIHVAAYITNGTAQRTIWCDGNHQTATDNFANSFTTTTAATIAYDAVDPMAYLRGIEVLAVVKFARAWTLAELNSLLDNPWGLFASVNTAIPYGFAATLPTLSAATYVPGTLSSTGFRPRVTATA